MIGNAVKLTWAFQPSTPSHEYFIRGKTRLQFPWFLDSFQSRGKIDDGIERLAAVQFSTLLISTWKCLSLLNIVLFRLLRSRQSSRRSFNYGHCLGAVYFTRSRSQRDKSGPRLPSFFLSSITAAFCLDIEPDERAIMSRALRFSLQERLRPPTYNAEDYAIALRRWGRRPLGSVQDSQGTLPSTTSSSSGYASGSGEMTLRQFTSVSELLNKLRADLRLAFPR